MNWIFTLAFLWHSIRSLTVAEALVVRDEVELQTAVNSLSCLSSQCEIEVNGEISVSQEVTILRTASVILSGAGGGVLKSVPGGDHSLIVIEGDLTTYNVTLSGTGSTTNGGGCMRVFGESSSLSALDGTIFSQCTSPQANGGGVIIADDATPTIRFKDVSVYDCAARSGGFLYNPSFQSIQFENVRIERCQATALNAFDIEGGGAIFSNGRIDLLGTTVISDCSAAQLAGAVLAPFVNMLGQSRVENCVAGLYGGGIFALFSAVISDNARITECIAGESGGCLFSFAHLEISGESQLDNCHAEILGGGAYASSSALFDNNAAIKNCSASIGGGVVLGSDRSNFIMAAQSTISNCSATFGGGIAVAGSQSEVQLLDNVTISYCSATFSAGGIYQFALTRLTMSGHSSVHDCTSGIAAGAFDINDGAELILLDSASIYLCMALEGNGGAVSLTSGSRFQMEKQTSISLSSANGAGGCLVMFYGSSTQVAGSMNTCSSNTFGGAVALLDDSSLDLLDGGTILNSKSSTFGGGINAYNYSQVKIHEGALISNCSTIENGGCVAVLFNSTLEVHGTISHCIGRKGGALYGDEAHLNVSGSIHSSIALDEGGCLYTYFFTDTYVLPGARLERCRAKIGAGVYSIGSGALVHLQSSSSISDSIASDSGGGVAVRAGVLRMDSDATIYNCQAQQNGGGVMLDSGALMTMSGGRISKCKAKNGGGFATTSDSRVVMTNKAMIDSNSASQDGGGGVVESHAKVFTSTACAYVIVKIDLSDPNTQLSGEIWVAATPVDAPMENTDFFHKSTNLVGIVGTIVTKELCLSRGVKYLFGFYSSQSLTNGLIISATIQVVELGTTDTLLLGQSQFSTDIQVSMPELLSDASSSQPLILSNQALRGGGLAIVQDGEGWITETNLTNNSATGTISRDGGGGALIIDGDGKAQLYDVILHYNKAALVSGGALESASKLAQITCSNCVFSENIAVTGGGGARVRGPASFSQCTFRNNSAVEGGGLLIDNVPSSVTVSIDNSTFRKNQAISKRGAGGGLTVRAANAMLTNGARFEANVAIDGADGGSIALRDTAQSIVTFQVENNNFRSVTVLVDWRNTTKSCLPSDILLFNSTCDSLSSGCAAIRDSESFSLLLREQILSLEQAGISGISESFEPSTIPKNLCDGCACHGKDERYVEISLVTNDDEILTHSWRCEPRSGALHECEFLLPVDSEYQIKIVDTLGDSFWGGSASVYITSSSDALASLSPADIDGFESKIFTFYIPSRATPNFSITGSRAFQGSGGALSVDDGNRDTLPENYDAIARHDNVAVYGDDIASPPRILRLVNNASLPIRAASGMIDTSVSPISVEVIDTYGQRALTETGTSAASISILNQGNNTVANSEKLFEFGVATFANALFTDRPGSTIEIEISSSSLQSLITNRVNSTIQFRNCDPGEIVDSVTESTFRCAPCLRGEYWFENECFECESGMVCNEAGLTLNLIQADKGRYRFAETSDLMYKCPSGGTGCPGGSGVGQDLCNADGYLGALCGACARGWFQSRKSNSQQKCTKCNHSKRVLAGTVLIVVCLLLVISVEFCIITTWGQNLVKKFIGKESTFDIIDLVSNDSTTEASEMSFLAGFKILFAFYQMLGAIPTVFTNLILPSSYTRITSIMGTISGLAFSNVLPTKCLFGDVSNFYYYIASHQLTFWLPIVSIGIVLISAYYLCSDNLHRMVGVARSHDPRVTYQVAFLIIYILTPTCTLVMTSSLACEKFDNGEDSDESFLRAAMDIGCDSHRYQNIIRPLGILGVLVYPALIVLGYIGILIYYRNAIADDGNFMNSWRINGLWLDGEDPTPEQQEDLLHTIQHNKQAAKRRLRRLNEENSGALYCAFFWTNYSTQVFYWDLMEVLRRIFLTALISFVAPGSRLQIVIALFVSVVYCYMHGIIQPRLSLIEYYTASVTDICLSITYFITLLLRTNIGLSKRSAFAQAVLNVAFIVPFVFQLIAFSTNAQQRKNFLHRLCCRSSSSSSSSSDNHDAMHSRDSLSSIDDGSVKIGPVGPMEIEEKEENT